MEAFTRRKFLKAASALSALAVLPVQGTAQAGEAFKISFSTLGCPSWDLHQIVSFAKLHRYHGIEFRGLNGQLDLLKSPQFSKSEIGTTRQVITENGLQIVCLGSSAQMHHRDSSTLNRNMDEGKAYIDLAAALRCPFIRVFPEKLIPDQDPNSSLDWIGTNMANLGDYAKGTGVTVLLESHGDLVRVSDLLKVMSATGNVGLIWDIVNMWSVTGEEPNQVLRSLASFIKHVHVKDFVKQDGKLKYVLPGKGDAPLNAALSLLKTHGYNGFLSFEWEKLWHPELEEPETALAYFPQAVSNLLK